VRGRKPGSLTSGGRTACRGVEWAQRRGGAAVAIGAVTGLLLASPAMAAPPSTAPIVDPSPGVPTATVIVTPANRPDPYNSGAVGNAAADQQDSDRRAARTQSLHGRVALLHARVDRDLPAASGVVAQVTPDELAALGTEPDLVVTPDVSVAVADASFTTSTTRAPAAVFPQSTGATRLWSNGVDGTGITVAVLDTGIDRLPDFSGRVIGGVDLSGEGNPYQDSYGHGTFVAGLIAGNGASSNGTYMGEAPGANLVAVKVAGASGVTDVATVIAGINWVVAHRDQFAIRVLNLSLGAIPTTSTVLNPLDQAVETAWQAGITVVISAGNAGPYNGTILSPGDDPLAITVGGVDDNGTPKLTDDIATTFSSVGPTNIDGWFKPDLVASARSVVSLRAPGSTIDTTYPSAEIGAGNFVGSGTSFSAAITSGAVALIAEVAQLKNKMLTPDLVKAEFLATASPGPVGNPMVDGHGALNVFAAVSQPGFQLTQTVPAVATSVGSSVNLETTWLPSSWNPRSWSGSTVNPVGTSISGTSGPVTTDTSTVGTTWNGSTWNGSTWNGSSWNGSTWNGSSWNGSSWNGSSWNGSSWNGSSWNGSSWNGSSWNGTSWS
jgi:serine protease AprX